MWDFLAVAAPSEKLHRLLELIVVPLKVGVVWFVIVGAAGTIPARIRYRYNFEPRSYEVERPALPINETYLCKQGHPMTSNARTWQLCGARRS